jgi:type I restriction enzyme M protein
MAKRNEPERVNSTAESKINGKAGRNGAKKAASAAPRPPSIAVQRQAGKIYSHVRRKFLVETPEERVRQTYLTVLVNEYGYSLDQFTEEETVVGRGSGQARADFIIWRTIQDKNDQKPPLIVVECKSDNVTIRTPDYHQGDHYARLCSAKFFITHNTRETRYWRVRQDRMPGYLEEIENVPHADASDKEIEELISKLREFKENEFADLLHQCHNVIRNRDHLDPAAAFDEIAKILFIKSWVEREMQKKRTRQNLFTADWLDSQLGENPLQELFRQTKEAFRADRIFDERERLNLKAATGREIVRLLEKYNLSNTSEDVKGIAFERFLGRTFRGEIGQFFTPRSIVEFMVRMVDPREGDVVCDPASGSGGFLIRFFEIVREKILADADRQYQDHVGELTAKKSLSETKRAELLRVKFDEIQKTLDQTRKGSRLWALANRCIYGCDANDRMARTSKMNMIMHGDGHGGVHHHNGFINVNGIFEGRFNIILTNPPFGASVEATDKVTDTDVAISDEEYERYAEAYGPLYKEAKARAQAAKGKPIASLFDLPRTATSKVRTEILFIERCLALLAPGGRLGIVLPESVFNNPSLSHVRRFCEDRAFLRAVVSLPQETFLSSGASVKASLLFMQKYTDEEKARYDEIKAKAVAEVDASHAPAIEKETAHVLAEIEAAKEVKDTEKRQALRKQLRDFQTAMTQRKAGEVLQLLKERFDYSIFLYDALHVGINAVGDDNVPNELVPNDRMPAGISASALELAQQFKQNPEGFIVPELGAA